MARLPRVEAQNLPAVMTPRPARLTAQAGNATSEFLRRVGIGKRYHACARDRIAEPALLRFLDELSRRIDEGRGVVLCGPPGGGKTGALAVIAATLGGPWEYIRYRTATEIMQELAHLARGGKEDKSGCYGEWDKILLLDEFGAAYESEWTWSLLENYLGWRYDDCRPTCVASNLTVEALRGNVRYARLLDRWRETNELIVMAGKSMRTSSAV